MRGIAVGSTAANCERFRTPRFVPPRVRVLVRRCSLTRANRISETYTMAQSLSGRRSRRSLDVKVKLEADLDGLVRQLVAAALLSKATPRKATMAHGAVVLTVLEEGLPRS
jgi:hypothetical protein